MSYRKYAEIMTKIADIQFASAVLQWDQETYMPPKGANRRAGQLASLATYAHQLFTDKALGSLLLNLKNDTTLDAKEKKNIAHSLRDYNIRTKYPSAFVEEMSLQVSKTFNAWQEAKQKNNFSIYEPELEKLIALKLKETELLGYTNHPYDALLDQYEPDLTVRQLDILFEDVRLQLVPFVKQISAKNIVDDFMFFHYDKNKQWDFGLKILNEMGYDFESGRQDISSHPFTTNFGSNDVRVTTRINENDLNEMIWSCIHEGGHALYEQGLPNEYYGLPLGEPVSLAIHESQSRFWENNIGRSKFYWQNYYSYLQSVFPDNLKNVNLNDFYCAMNAVKPSLIRTNADELTYHFHVMIRYEIEKLILERKVKVAELPDLWNQKYKDYLGIEVPDFARGILQDVHWSHGSFGYFPTYSLGSFYAAQFYSAMKNEIPDIEIKITNGNFKPVLEWLRNKIHIHGKYYSARELAVNITGQELNFSYFMKYAIDKYETILTL